jgi:hypothetical protein
VSQSQDDAKALLDAANTIVEAKVSLARAEAEFASVLQASSGPQSETEDHWSNYVEYNKSIRAWVCNVRHRCASPVPRQLRPLDRPERE